MTYFGQIKDGQLALTEQPNLPEGTMLRVEIQTLSAERPTIWDKLLKHAGTIEGLPPDAAENHDHYLYGAPRHK